MVVVELISVLYCLRHNSVHGKDNRSNHLQVVERRNGNFGQSVLKIGSLHTCHRESYLT